MSLIGISRKAHRRGPRGRKCKAAVLEPHRRHQPDLPLCELHHTIRILREHWHPPLHLCFLLPRSN